MSRMAAPLPFKVVEERREKAKRLVWQEHGREHSVDGVADREEAAEEIHVETEDHTDAGHDPLSLRRCKHPFICFHCAAKLPPFSARLRAALLLFLLSSLCCPRLHSEGILSVRGCLRTFVVPRRGSPTNEQLVVAATLAQEAGEREHQKTASLIRRATLQVELPHGCLNLLTAMYGESFGIRIYDHLGSFMEMLTLLYSSISFVLYCTMSNDYLRTFRSLFCPCSDEKDLNANGWWNSLEG